MFEPVIPLGTDEDACEKDITHAKTNSMPMSVMFWLEEFSAHLDCGPIG